MSPNQESLRAQLRHLLPELADLPIQLQARDADVPSRHRHGIAFVGDFVVKFAWSESADRILLGQARVLTALVGQALAMPIPVPLAVSTDPALLIYRRLPGTVLPWSAKKGGDAGAILRIGRQLGELLGQIHEPSILRRVDSAGVALPSPVPQATPDELRRRMFPLLDRRRTEEARSLVDRVAQVLRPASARTFLHGDFHGHNLLLSEDSREIIGLIDFEEAAAGDPAYDLRYLPALAPSLELLFAVMRSYEQSTGSALDLQRVLAWHVLSDLGDALWRTEQGVEVVDGPLARRFDTMLERLKQAGW